MRLSELDGARVAVWGAGREGTAVLAALARGASPESVALVADEPSGLPAAAPAGVSMAAGDEGAALLRAADVVIRSPGISLYRDDVRALREAGVRLTTATNIFMAEHTDNTVVGVTGTKGKSTTASLLFRMLDEAGIDAALGGNVGRPLLGLDVGPQTTVVAELSSYQLADLERPLEVAVVLNVFPEHLPWHGDLETYVADKLRAVTLSGATRAVLNGSDPRLRRLGAGRGVTWFETAETLHAREDGVWRGGQLVIAAEDIPLLGIHNLRNVAAALTTAELLGAPTGAALDGARSFEPLPHRLQTVLTDSSGRVWVDDSISTTPESTLAALAVFDGRPLTILLGGTDRGQEHDALVVALQARGVQTTALLLPDTGARIAAALGTGAVDARPVATVDEAVALAGELTPDGGVVLLSPAAASFPAFSSFEERGDRFTAAARELDGWTGYAPLKP